ncbi:MAG: protein-L-isoaspartate O-methyltransferase family protein [Novosphingobium sp.]
MTVTTAVRPATDQAAARRAMIDSQLRVSDVTDAAALGAMGRVAREDFVPLAARDSAYIDRAIPLGDGRALPAPLVHGTMLGEAAPRPADTALVVDCGAGYLAALVEGMAGKVTVLTPAEAASKKGKGGYSLVLVEGAIEQLPAGLAAQLAEGGRIVTGLVVRGVTRLAAGRKVAGAVALLPLAEIGMPVLAEFAAPRRWSF